MDSFPAGESRESVSWPPFPSFSVSGCAPIHGDSSQTRQGGGDGRAANFAMAIPDPLPSRNAVESVDAQPVGVRSPELVGAAAERGNWGEGVTVAVLDGRVGTHVTFQEGQVRLAPGWETGAAASELSALGHGTGVASLIAGFRPAPGPCRAPLCCSFPVIDAQGFGDTFTTASAIVQAVDSGARVINVSLGTFSDSSVLGNITMSRNVAVVAAAGSEECPPPPIRRATRSDRRRLGGRPFPAPSVFQHGQRHRHRRAGLRRAGRLAGQALASVSGTSASTPLVSGAVAAVLSENPGITAIDAAALLTAYANKGGLPGADEAYGAGVLNIRRVCTRNERGITDAAVASHVLQPAAGPGPPSSMLPSETGGTETLRGLQLESRAGNGYRGTFYVSHPDPRRGRES